MLTQYVIYLHLELMVYMEGGEAEEEIIIWQESLPLPL